MIIGEIANLLTRETFDQYREEMQHSIQREINHRYPRAEFETFPTPETGRITENAIRNIQRTMKTKLFTLFLALVASVGTTLEADTKIGDLYYSFDTPSKTATVTYQNNEYYNYSGLTVISIPTSVDYNGTTYSVTSIGSLAFKGCSSLKSITNYATTPQTISSNVFQGVRYSTCTLYVPEESIELYKAAEGWKEFTKIQAISNTAIDGIGLDSKQSFEAQKLLRNGQLFILRGDKTYTIQGQKVR